MTQFIELPTAVTNGFDGNTETVDLTVPNVSESSNGHVPTRTVAIVGFAGSSRELVNNEPESTEVWGLNNGYTFMKRKAARWFDIHSYQGRDEFREQHWARMLEMDIPIYAIHPPVPQPENVIRMDYKRIAEELGAREYFTNSIAYMIAQAIYEGVDELKVFGVDMATGSEFAHQRACCEYWIGMAEGRGMKVHMAEASPLLRGLLYGVDRDDGYSKAMLLDQMTTLREQERQAIADYHQTKGGIEQVRLLVTAFGDYERDHAGVITVDDIRGIMGASMEKLQNDQNGKSAQYHCVNGALQATRNILNKLHLPDTSHGDIELESDPDKDQ